MTRPGTLINFADPQETPPDAALELDFVYKPYGVHIGNGVSWPLCQPPRAIHDKYIRRLLDWCPEAKSACLNSTDYLITP